MLLKNSRFEKTGTVSIMSISRRVLSKLLILHITRVRNQTEHLLGTLFHLF